VSFLFDHHYTACAEYQKTLSNDFELLHYLKGVEILFENSYATFIFTLMSGYIKVSSIIAIVLEESVSSVRWTYTI